MRSKSRHVRGYLDVKVYTVRKFEKSAHRMTLLCDHSLRHDETIDILIIA